MIFSSRKISRYFLTFSCLCTISTASLVKSESLKQTSAINKDFNSSYLNSNEELKDYIIDKGDNLFIDFYPAEALTGFYSVNEEGELFLPKLRGTYVRGLTPLELEKFLKQKYSEFIISPNIKVNIAKFRGLNITVLGEVRYPGVYKFQPFISSSVKDYLKGYKSEINPLSTVDLPELETQSTVNSLNIKSQSTANSLNINPQFTENTSVSFTVNNLITISDAIRKAGGITSSSDLGKIQIIRDVPFGKGGGKKTAILNLSSLLNDPESKNDIRLFDGDSIYIPALGIPSKSQVPKSVLAGLSPRFVKVNVFGRVNTTGEFMLPLEGTLSDAIDITGPIKPLSGKVIIIRYNPDGTISKKKIDYSARAPRGSKRNPFVKEGDLITVTSSILGKTTEVIKEFTSPFIGIYTTKELIEDFSE